MVSPARSLSRLALVATAVASLLAGPSPALAQSGGISLIRDTEIEDILHKDAAPIFEAAGIDPKSIHILLIGGKDLQAFAAPSTMAVYTGLILESENPNQLQGVIGHEVGHLAAGHVARSGEMNAAGMKPFLLTMGLGVLAALAGAPDMAAVLAGNASYFGALGAMGYSREQEGRADQAGITILEKADISGRGLVEFFDNFRYQEVFDEARRFAYFRSHPLSSARIESLRHRAEAQAHYSELDSPEAIAEHAIMKAKLDGFINPQKVLADPENYSDKSMAYPVRYARAIAYYQTKEPEKALRLIDALLAEQPDNPYLWELKGQVLFEFGRAPEAEAPQRRSVALKPDAPLLRVNLGQTLIALDDKAKIDEGIVELKKALVQEDDNAVAWRILAEAYDKKGEDGLARYATAEYSVAIGDKRSARMFAARAREMLTKGTPEWLKSNDIVLTSSTTREERREIAGEAGGPSRLAIH